MNKLYLSVTLWVTLLCLLGGCGRLSGRMPSDEFGLNDAPIRLKSNSNPPLNSYYYFTEAQLMMKSGEVEQAIAFMEQAIEMDPQSALLKRSLASLLIHQKKPAQALELVRSALASDPKDAEAWILLGRIKQDQQQHDEAAKAFESAIALSPHRQDVYLVLGNIYMQEQRWDEALHTYQTLIQRFPGAYAGHYFMGKIYAQKGQPFIQRFSGLIEHKILVAVE